MGRIAMTCSQAIHHLTVVFYGWGGGPLINVPSVPTVTRTENGPKNLHHFLSVPTLMRTVNGPKNVDYSNGDPSPPCSVIGG